MPLPDSFQFSQSSLQDYVDCPRRFELRYILHQKWPALQTQPVIEFEHHMEQGQRFHRLVQQHILGIPLEHLNRQAKDAELQRWWDNYLRIQPTHELPLFQIPEYLISGSLAGFRTAAKYDLLAIAPGEKAVIIDWKTSLKKPRPSILRDRIQSRLYPFLLTSCGSILNNGTPFQPEQIKMIYWYPEFPNEPEIIEYDSAQFQSDRRDLTLLIQSIHAREDGTFELTEESERCKFCSYRSLCERGDKAGDFTRSKGTDLETDDPLNLDFDQLWEIEI